MQNRGGLRNGEPGLVSLFYSQVRAIRLTSCFVNRDETFVFNLGSTPDTIDEDVNLCLYDYDLALNDFLGFCRVDLKGKSVSKPSDWSKTPRWYNVGTVSLFLFSYGQLY